VRDPQILDVFLAFTARPGRGARPELVERVELLRNPGGVDRYVY